MEGRPLQDPELIELAKDGDVQAYEELVQRHREVAFRTAYLITRSAADADEAARDRPGRRDRGRLAVSRRRSAA